MPPLADYYPLDADHFVFIADDACRQKRTNVIHRLMAARDISRI